jgi:hypothetical protein
MDLYLQDLVHSKSSLLSFLLSRYPSTVVASENASLVTYRIEKGEISIGRVFKELEENKAQLLIEDYAGQTLLFLTFTRFLLFFYPGIVPDFHPIYAIFYPEIVANNFTLDFNLI